MSGLVELLRRIEFAEPGHPRVVRDGVGRLDVGARESSKLVRATAQNVLVSIGYAVAVRDDATPEERDFMLQDVRRGAAHFAFGDVRERLLQIVHEVHALRVNTAELGVLQAAESLLERLRDLVESITP